MTLEAFEAMVRSRRAVRRFRPDPVPQDLLERLVDSARWAPSGYNLQPTHFVIVTNASLKNRLRAACLDQRQITEAPAVVVFCGDRRAYENNFEKSVSLDLEAGAADSVYAARLRSFTSLAFKQGPFGIQWFFKAIGKPFLRMAKPTPDIPAVDKRYWLTKQVMLASMTFMLAAKSAGLATVPMEGFDETRVRKVLGIPDRFIVPVVIPVGTADEAGLKKTRIPLQDMLHRNGW